MQFSSILPVDTTLSGVTTPGQSETGSDSNAGVLRISQSSNITRTSPSDCLVSYPGNTLGMSYSLCRDAVGIFYSPTRLSKTMKKKRKKGKEERKEEKEKKK